MATPTPSSSKWRGEVLPVVKNTPVLAGVNGTDPFRDMDVFLDQIKALGFAGVQNFPTVGLIDGVFRANLEETGMSYALEVEMIAKRPRQGYADHALCIQRGRCRRRWLRQAPTSSSAISA